MSAELPADRLRRALQKAGRSARQWRQRHSRAALKLLDVNVVLAAHRDDHPDFQTARKWLDQTTAAGTPFAVVDLVAGAFLRIATNRRIFSIPTPADEAFAYLKALRAQPSHVMLAPGPGHLALLAQVCTSAEASGDLIADAQLAAIALEHACELVSFDRDFARFSELNWSRPSPKQTDRRPASSAITACRASPS